MPWPVGELHVRFEATKRRDDVGPCPARVPTGGPRVKVGGRAANGKPRQPGGAAEQAAAAQSAGAPGSVGLGLEAPVGRLAQSPAVRCRVGIRLAARLEERDRRTCSLNEPSSEHAAGRAGADDHDVRSVRGGLAEGVRQSAISRPVRADS
jgi:hypothetical protein